MQEADGGVEADALCGAATIMGQQSIEKGQQGVDGIERRTAAAAHEADLRIRRANEIAENREIDLRSLALGTAQDIHTLIRKSAPTKNAGEPIDDHIDSLALFRCHLRAIIAQRPLQ